MVRAWTRQTLAAATLPRQFPRVRGDGPDAVVELVRRLGPVQSQAARAPFLAVAARLPGATRDAVRTAHESQRLVRSTSLRGTVHTSTSRQHAALSAVANRALAPFWRRTLQLTEEQLEGFRAELERLSESGWVTNDELEAGMREWFADQGCLGSLKATESQAGRYAFRGHPAMLRRPLARGWEGQGEVAYRAARWVLTAAPMDPQAALVTLVREHIAASGPVSRRDLAWWSGAGLRQVDEALAALGDEVVSRPGPAGLDYHDLAVQRTRSTSDPGIRLVPEYDALLLAYDPAARDRFADEAAVAHSWNRANGVHSPTLLADGRLRGRWRLDRTGDQATIGVEMFPGERILDPGDLTDQASAVGAVLAVTVTDVRVTPVP